MKCICPKYKRRLVTQPGNTRVKPVTVPVCANCGRNPPISIFPPLPVYSIQSVTKPIIDTMMIQYASECVRRALDELTETLRGKLI